MDYINLSNLLSMNEFWSMLISYFVDFIGNYGWAIIVFTICLKLLLSPLEYYQRVSTKKNSKIQALVAPEIAKIQQKYPDDKNKQNQLTMEVYKKHNFNIGGMCGIMLLYMGITLFLFITLFNSLGVISTENLVSQYTRLEAVYTESEDNSDIIILEYQEIKDENSWLWVKNVFKSDTKTSIMLSFDEYYSEANLDLSDEEKEIAELRYNEIMNIIYEYEGDGSWNGYYILVILAGLVSFFSQWATMHIMNGKKVKNNTDPTTAGTQKIMMIILPIVMIIFAYQSSALFALYLITNSFISVIISYLSNLIQESFDKDNKKNKRQAKKVKQIEKVAYSRDYFGGNE